MPRTINGASAEKKRLRRAFKARLAELDEKARLAASVRIAAKLREVLPPEGVIGLYLAMPDEPNLDALAEGLSRAGRLALPAAPGNGRGPLLRWIEGNRWGGWETKGELRLAPASAPAFSPKDLALLVLPALAFDAEGFRLGRGGGYYDRILEEAEGVPTVGVCFSCQRIERLPREAHDRPVGQVITE